eukprot:15599748-Heterocapsa_arctica.AAC.1
MARSRILVGKRTNKGSRKARSKSRPKEDAYPGVSSQERVRLRAKPLFQEGATKKAARKLELLDNRQLKHIKQDRTYMEDRDSKRPKACLGNETNQQRNYKTKKQIFPYTKSSC